MGTHFGERERGKQKKKERKRTTFLFIDWPCIDLVDEARYAENSAAFYRSKLIYFKNSTVPLFPLSLLLDCMSHFGWNAAN